ncbi:response regulator [Rurimicrobium arvi]
MQQNMSAASLACVIDDDPIFVFATRKLMEMSGFADQIIVYRNGQEALDGLAERLREGRPLPDVILLDLNMPVLDGIQFLERFSQWELPVQMHLYLVTSSINPEDIKMANSFSVVRNYITKPLSLDIIEGLAEELRQAKK